LLLSERQFFSTGFGHFDFLGRNDSFHLKRRLKIPPFAQKIILTANGEPLGKRQILERLNAQRV